MTFTTSCPSCGESLDVDEDHRGWTVRCPQCRYEFVAEGDEPRARTRSRPLEPRRRRRRYGEDDYYDEPDFEAASQKVSGPGTFLEIVGWGGVLLSLVVIVICIIIGSEMENRPRKQANDEAFGWVVIGVCVGVIGIPYSIVLAIGARKMRNLSSRGMAMTSAILGIAAIALFGLLGVIHIAAGIWGLTALSDKNVERCFRAKARERESEFDDDDEDD